MKYTLPITEARKNIFTLVNDVSIKGTRYILTDKGHAKAIVMSVEEFETWQETLAVMKDFPDLDNSIKHSHQEYARGEYITLEKLLMNKGYVVANHAKKNELSSYTAKTRRKKTQRAG